MLTLNESVLEEVPIGTYTFPGRRAARVRIERLLRGVACHRAGSRERPPTREGVLDFEEKTRLDRIEGALSAKQSLIWKRSLTQTAHKDFGAEGLVELAGKVGIDCGAGRLMRADYT